MTLHTPDEIVKNLTKIILINKKRMIREDDLKHLCKGFDFDQIISNVYKNLLEVGFELISTKFLEQKYYVLTSEGKDDKISPSQYGTLALILALSKEIDENLKLSDLREIFSEVWTSDIEYLIKNDYLRKINLEGLDIIKITPLGKALMKNIIKGVKLKNLLKSFKKDLNSLDS